MPPPYDFLAAGVPAQQLLDDMEQAHADANAARAGAETARFGAETAETLAEQHAGRADLEADRAAQEADDARDAGATVLALAAVGGVYHDEAAFLAGTQPGAQAYVYDDTDGALDPLEHNVLGNADPLGEELSLLSAFTVMRRQARHRADVKYPGIGRVTMGAGASSQQCVDNAGIIAELTRSGTPLLLPEGVLGVRLVKLASGADIIGKGIGRTIVEYDQAGTEEASYSEADGVNGYADIFAPDAMDSHDLALRDMTVRGSASSIPGYWLAYQFGQYGADEASVRKFWDTLYQDSNGRWLPSRVKQHGFRGVNSARFVCERVRFEDECEDAFDAKSSNVKDNWQERWPDGTEAGTTVRTTAEECHATMNTDWLVSHVEISRTWRCAWNIQGLRRAKISEPFIRECTRAAWDSPARFLAAMGLTAGPDGTLAKQYIKARWNVTDYPYVNVPFDEVDVAPNRSTPSACNFELSASDDLVEYVDVTNPTVVNAINKVFDFHTSSAGDHTRPEEDGMGGYLERVNVTDARVYLTPQWVALHGLGAQGNSPFRVAGGTGTWTGADGQTKSERITDCGVHGMVSRGFGRTIRVSGDFVENFVIEGADLRYADGGSDEAILRLASGEVFVRNSAFITDGTGVYIDAEMRGHMVNSVISHGRDRALDLAAGSAFRVDPSVIVLTREVAQGVVGVTYTDPIFGGYVDAPVQTREITDESGQGKGRHIVGNLRNVGLAYISASAYFNVDGDDSQNAVAIDVADTALVTLEHTNSTEANAVEISQLLGQSNGASLVIDVRGTGVVKLRARDGDLGILWADAAGATVPNGTRRTLIAGRPYTLTRRGVRWWLTVPAAY